jgi:hypothetical protein
VDGDLPTSGSVAQAVGRTTSREKPQTPQIVEEQRAHYGELYQQYRKQTQSKTDEAIALRAIRSGHKPSEVAQILTQSPVVQAMSERQPKIDYIERTFKIAYEGFRQIKAEPESFL